MEIYLAGTPVTLTVPMQDRNGNALTVASISYRVVDQAGLEVVPLTPLASFVATATEAIIEITADVNNIAPVPGTINSNQIDAFAVRGVRTVELILNVGGNSVVLNKSYALEPTDPLVVGVNSFQNFPQAELTSLDIPNMPGWAGASDKEKIAAMVDARAHICQLNFWMLNSNINWGQDSLNYVPEGAYQSPYASGGNHLFIFNGNLSLLTPLQFDRLPARFKAALRLAQVAEADSILGGDPVDVRRREGLLSEAIGEVRQQFRAGKPLDMPVSKRALRYLSQFVSFAKKIGRG